MKKLFLLLACVAMSVLSMAQVNQLVWANGRLLYGSPITNVDSLTYDEVAGMDTLLLPRVLIKEVVKEVHDTVYVTQIVHDTVYVETDCGGNVENNHEYVDLGLSVKWATCNVGATKPEEYGDYFAWGEVEPKETYNWGTYKWCDGYSNSLTKYNTDSTYGTVDNKTVLEASDDAATANWGGAWRMPTREELYELSEQCTWTWTTQNGVNGCEVTSKKNGRSIFLPVAGGYVDDSLPNNAGSYGYYWSSSLHADFPHDSNATYRLCFGSSIMSHGSSFRRYGFSVRPVCQ